MPTKEEAISYLQSTDWEELGPVAQALADRVNDYRQENSGMTPRPIFKPCVEMGLSYACLELVVWVIGHNGAEKGVLLKKRDASDQGWEGLKHIPGRAVMPYDVRRSVINRLLDEYTRNVYLRATLAKGFGSEPYDDYSREDPDRRVNCLTLIYQIEIEEAIFRLDDLEPGFVIVTREQMGDKSIFAHHREVLQILLNSRE